MAQQPAWLDGFLERHQIYLKMGFLLVLVLLLLIPLVPLIFWFIPGTKGSNDFGPPPPPNRGSGIVVALLLVLVIVIGILAAIAIPAYQDYVERAKQAQMQSE